MQTVTKESVLSMNLIIRMSLILVYYNPNNNDMPTYLNINEEVIKVKGIYFGLKCGKSNKEIIKNIFSKRDERPEFYEMEYHCQAFMNYELKIKRL